jgi:hypothetical protein
MSVRKRKWITSTGEAKEAWIIDYVDQQGDRHIETFERKKDAEARHDIVRENVRQGVHTPANKSITVADAAEDWIAYVEREGRERSTVDQYRQHVRLHINPVIGRKKLAELTTPGVMPSAMNFSIGCRARWPARSWSATSRFYGTRSGAAMYLRTWRPA